MINETQRLQRFKDAVFSQVSGQAEEITAEAEKESEQKLKNAQAEAEAFLERKYSQADKKAQSDMVRAVSAKHLESKRKILLCREEIIFRVFDNVKNKLEKFRNTEDYKKLIIQKVKECSLNYPDDKGTLKISIKDKSYAKEFSLDGLFSVEFSQNIELGGFILVYSQRNLAFDYTFDNLLEQQREGFAAKAGLSL